MREVDTALSECLLNCGMRVRRRQRGVKFARLDLSHHRVLTGPPAEHEGSTKFEMLLIMNLARERLRSLSTRRDCRGEQAMGLVDHRCSA